MPKDLNRTIKLKSSPIKSLPWKKKIPKCKNKKTSYKKK